ncbi:MAG: ABC transporter ATP-binding protein [Bacteroidetes bacterium]|nr:ABC transporter ATP-binding protein [Bacteroidota bacterium]
MTISLSDAGKRYNRDWIFRHFNYSFESGKSYAITGPNGSGKSTLLQAIGGSLLLNEGKIDYTIGAKPCSAENAYRHVSICAPYLELIEEMSVKEFLDFHHGFKPFLPGITDDFIIRTIGLEKAVKKQIRYYSSGMKQRVKLAQCIFSDTALVLLDEPCTNLDSTGIRLYHDLINRYCQNRLVVVSSNDEVEYGWCKAVLNISDYKSN